MIITATQWREFCVYWQSDEEIRRHLRLGQAFYNWAELHKMTQTPWLDKLYNADNATVRRMVRDVFDPHN